VILTKKDGSILKIDPTQPKKFITFAKRAGGAIGELKKASALHNQPKVREVKVELVKNTLDKYNQEFYTIEELTAKKKPPGVDVTALEKYLTDEDFQKTFSTTKVAFYALPAWKRLTLRKNTKLY